LLLLVVVLLVDAATMLLVDAASVLLLVKLLIPPQAWLLSLLLHFRQLLHLHRLLCQAYIKLLLLPLLPRWLLLCNCHHWLQPLQLLLSQALLLLLLQLLLVPVCLQLLLLALHQQHLPPAPKAPK
jgi:hypothetical protein